MRGQGDSELWEILKETGITGGQILVCAGTSFADSLSASSVGKPILLVSNNSESLARTLGEYATVARIGGATRYETSVLVTEYFVETPGAAVLTYVLKIKVVVCGEICYTIN